MPSLRQDLLDARDRLVDRLLGADALGDDAVDGLAPDVLPTRPVRVANRRTATAKSWARGRVRNCMAAAMRCGSLGSSQNGASSSFGIGGRKRSPEKSR